MATAGSSQGDDLSSFADTHIPSHEGPDFAGRWAEPYAQSLRRSGLDRDAISTHLAVMFWQIAMGTEAFDIARLELALPPSPWFEREELVVSHGDPDNPQFNLVVLDDGYPDEPRVLRLDPSQDDLIQAHQAWRDDHLDALKSPAAQRRMSQVASSLLTDLVLSIDAGFAIRALADRPFYVLAARRPPRLFTGVPMAPWPVSAARGGTLQASAGAVVRHQKNTKQVGVTIAAHTILNGSQRSPVGRKVNVNGQVGTVISCDIISDSCFVELGHIGAPNHVPSVINGVLQGIPTLGVSGRFEGCTSGLVSTTIQAVNVNVAMTRVPMVQQTFNLSQPTRPGDSGCAFLDANDVLTGFALASTQGGIPPQYSTWIWVDPVFSFHSLQAF